MSGFDAVLLQLLLQNDHPGESPFFVPCASLT
jgi:hypothetical protein